MHVGERDDHQRVGGHVERDVEIPTEGAVPATETGHVPIEAVGDGALNTETGARIPLTVKKGDKVIFNSYAGTEVKLDGDELLIMSEDDILAVIDE